MSKPKFRQSLLFRYTLIIAFAFLFLPMIIPMASISQFVMNSMFGSSSEPLKYGSLRQLEDAWHAEAAAMGGWTDEQIDSRLRELKDRYEEGKLFWVNESGQTALQLPPQEGLPQQWTHNEAIRFMKQSVNSDPYTVVSFIGSEHEQSSFIVIQMPRELMIKTSSNDFPMLAVVLLILACFAVLSLLFIRDIRKRLLRLEAAMSLDGRSELPAYVTISKHDEIGQLESAFNRMIAQLQESKQREAEEEDLRKQLIANLSHDLRTPLTVMNGHIYNLRKEPISPSGELSIRQLERKISDLGGLIDNLLSYTLMTSGRYPLKLEPQDTLRIVKECAAAWYPLWEKEGIAADIQLQHTDDATQRLIWQIDREAFRRVLDNLIQNVVRHAKQGGFIAIRTEQRNGGTALVIVDAGGGMSNGASSKGAGIGLAIVRYLTNEMGLALEIVSTEQGVSVYIYPLRG